MDDSKITEAYNRAITLKTQTMKYLSLSIIPTLLLAAGVLTLNSSAGAVTELQPELTPFPAEDLTIETTDDGDRLLRFSTLSWNKGDGPLEIVAGSVDEASSTQKVYQRVYLSDGSYYDRKVGDFVWHEEHNHFHLEDFAAYTLQPVDAPGASERTGTKMSFCLMDTDRIDHKLDGAPKRPQYTSCSDTIQGISVGWGDKYGYQLPGQSIDITGLPDGTYNLTIDVDPKDQLLEMDESNNAETIQILIEGTNVSLVDSGGEDDDGGNGNNGGGNDDPPGHGGTPPGRQ